MTFLPVRCLIEDVTQSTNAEVTTTTDHGYLSGMVVRVIVPPAYGMSVYETSSITVTGLDTFTTNIDTSSELPFVAPTFVANGQAFTEAQVVPVTGTEQNIL